MSLNDILIWPLDGPLTVRLAEQLRHPCPQLEIQINELWNANCAQQPDLRNGLIFSLQPAPLDPPANLVTGCFVEYRLYHAQIFMPEIRDLIGVRPLGVTGLILCDNAVLMGKRVCESALQGGMWEIVPAGGIDPTCLQEDNEIDTLKQIFDEFSEEVGIPSSSIREARQIYWMLDQKTGIRDIVFLLHPQLDLAQFEENIRGRRTKEHSKLAFVPIDEANAFFAENGERCSLASMSILNRIIRDSVTGCNVQIGKGLNK